MKEINQEFDFKFGDTSLSIKASSVNKPWIYARVNCGTSSKKLKELGESLIQIANEIENDKDFKNK